MRSNRLADLKSISAAGVSSAIPDFDFYRLGDVLFLSLDFSDDDYPPTTPLLEIRAVYRSEPKNHVVRLVFRGVRQLELPPIGSHLGFVELEVEDVRTHQLEGISFEIIDHFDHDFLCRCGGLEVTVLE